MYGNYQTGSGLLPRKMGKRACGKKTSKVEGSDRSEISLSCRVHDSFRNHRS